MSEWQPIETALEELPFAMLGGTETCPAFKSYASALVCGPTWEADGWDDWPKTGKGAWTGEVRVAIASTYEGKGFWTIESDGPADYNVHIQPTHWMPLPAPPEQSK